jgi:hypothetical protein
MVSNATFNYNSVITWRSALLQTGVSRENNRPTDALYHMIMFRVHLAMSVYRTQHDGIFLIYLNF